MGYIVDISKYEPSNQIEWPTFSKNLDLLIVRVQYGSNAPDTEYVNHVANAKQFGVPFMSYAFPEFVSVNDARVEARDAATREDKESLAMIIDIEPESDKQGNPVGIAKLAQSDRLEGIKAFVDELRNQHEKKVGAYISNQIYQAWGLDTIINIFDFVWIPRYGVNNGAPSTKPDFPCDLWQYTSEGHVPGYAGPLDLSTLNGDKSLEWFTGGVKNVEVKVEVVKNSDYVGKNLIVKVDHLWFYDTPRWDIKSGESQKGDKFIITEELLVNGVRMVKCHDGKYRTADPKYVDVSPKPLDWPYRVIVEGITNKQAIEIVQSLQSQYKNASVHGESL